MTSLPHRPLFWIPRLLGILFALFLGIFAFDVFDTGESFWLIVAGFLIHLIPTYLVLIAVALGWGWPRLGSILFFTLAALAAVMVNAPLYGKAIIAIPLLLIGLLFLLDWRAGEQVQTQP